MPSRFFKASELACKCGCGKGEADMDQAFLNRLDMLRTAVNEPMVLTSAFRCNNWNMKCGGEPKSYHLTGRAVDIACADSARRHKIVANALQLGFTVGIDAAFVHVDSRDGLKFIFLYPVKEKPSKQ